MKKLWSQISVAVVCAILGFMLTYQFKIINFQGSGNVGINNADVTAQIASLTKQKEELTKKVNSMQAQLTEYEKSALNGNSVQQALYAELNTDRMMVGALPVKGEGVIMYIDPVGTFLNGQGQPITADDLVYTVNYMFSIGAEAVSINDIRIGSRTGIKGSSGGLIKIGTNFVNSYKRITIKAIGDKDKMGGALDGWLPIQPTDLRTIKTEKSDSINIPKLDTVSQFNYAKPVTTK